MQTAKNFAQEHNLETVETNLKKLSLLSSHLEYQLECISRSSLALEEVTEQVRAMQR